MRVNIVANRYGDWSAYYINGTLVHYHDTLSDADLLELLRIEHTWEEDVGVLGDRSDEAPLSYEEYEQKRGVIDAYGELK